MTSFRASGCADFIVAVVRAHIQNTQLIWDLVTEYVEIKTVDNTDAVIEGMFSLTARVRMHALKGLACRKRSTQATLAAA